MTAKTIWRAAQLALPLLAAAPALAQGEEEQGRPYDRNSLTIGLGGAYVPSYDGSDDYILTPIGLAFGKVSGFGFATRGTALYVDLIPDKRNSAVDFDFGPLANVRLDRTNRIKDSRVRALGEFDTAIELGAWAGLRKNGVFHEYDSLGARLAWQKDVTDTHDGTILTPAIEYSSPLSTRLWSASASRPSMSATATPAPIIRSARPVRWRAALPSTMPTAAGRAGGRPCSSAKL